MPDLYRFNCIDNAASAGYSYKRQVGGDVYVCVDGDHAQAYVVENQKQKWLTVHVDHGTHLLVLIVDWYPELDDIQFCVTLEEFNNLYGR